MAKLPSYVPMRVPLLDLSEQYRALGDSIREAIDAVLQSGRFILGPNVEALEKAVCEYCHVRHAIGEALSQRSQRSLEDKGGRKSPGDHSRSSVWAVLPDG